VAKIMAELDLQGIMLSSISAFEWLQIGKTQKNLRRCYKRVRCTRRHFKCILRWVCPSVYIISLCLRGDTCCRKSQVQNHLRHAPGRKTLLQRGRLLLPLSTTTCNMHQIGFSNLFVANISFSTDRSMSSNVFTASSVVKSGKLAQEPVIFSFSPRPI